MNHLLATALLGSMSALLAADGFPIRLPLSFEAPSFHVTTYGTQDVTSPGLMNTFEGGLPSVPVKTFKIALPPGTKSAEVKIKGAKVRLEPVTVSRAMPQTPISMMGQAPTMAHLMNPDCYTPFEGQTYPASRSHLSLQTLHNTPIAIVNVYPVLVTKDKGVEILESGELEITPVINEPIEPSRPRFEHQVRQIKEFVDNPEAVSFENIRTQAVYDYLILSTDELINYKGANSLEELQKNLEGSQLRTRIASVKQINSGSGSDLIEKIRDYIRSEYKQNGIQYVLLVGDADASGSGNMIPVRKLWSKMRALVGSNWTTLEENIASDLYYTCLDGPFNSNGNTKWGEPSDGENGKDVDLLSEVAVGRISVKTPQELQNVIRKILWFKTNRLPKKILMAGELLFREINIWGDDYMDQLIGQCSDHGFETKGFPAGFEIKKLYDRPGEWNGTTALKNLNDGGFALVNHLGHSTENMNMRINWTASSAPKFTNQNPFFLYTQGCLCGKFTQNDCIIERLHKHKNGAAAVIANSTYGLCPEDPEPSKSKTPGASQMIHRQFIHMMLNGPAKTLGWANQKSKEAFVGLTSHQEMRWGFWTVTVFGDPSITFNF